MKKSKIKALSILEDNLKKTKFNFYPKLKLRKLSSVTDKELWQLMQLGHIERRIGATDTLIVFINKK